MTACQAAMCQESSQVKSTLWEWKERCLMVSCAGVNSGAPFLAKALEPCWCCSPLAQQTLMLSCLVLSLPNFTRSDSKSILYAQDCVGCLNNHLHLDQVMALGYLLAMWVGAGYIML